MVYALAFSDVERRTGGVKLPPDPQLRRLADDSGGGYFEVTSADRLGPLFTRVAEELHRHRVLARLRAAPSRRQGAPDRRQGETVGHDGARPADLRRAARALGRFPLTLGLGQFGVDGRRMSEPLHLRLASVFPARAPGGRTMGRPQTDRALL